MYIYRFIIQTYFDCKVIDFLGGIPNLDTGILEPAIRDQEIDGEALLLLTQVNNVANKSQLIMDHGKKRSSEFCPIFSVAFLLFLAPAEGSNPAGQSSTFT